MRENTEPTQCGYWSLKSGSIHTSHRVILSIRSIHAACITTRWYQRFHFNHLNCIICKRRLLGSRTPHECSCVFTVETHSQDLYFWTGKQDFDYRITLSRPPGSQIGKWMSMKDGNEADVWWKAEKRKSSDSPMPPYYPEICVSPKRRIHSLGWWE